MMEAGIRASRCESEKRVLQLRGQGDWYGAEAIAGRSLTKPLITELWFESTQGDHWHFGHQAEGSQNAGSDKKG
ncbi:hypothetical protein [Ensifer sp. 4252]|uniref:hypothetical protein n=1 Tax=Ensifer sp. 4252 TaxID=3373915 RepID=UPI003D1DC4ED